MKRLLTLLSLSAACATPSVEMCSDAVVPVARGSITGEGGSLTGLASFDELGVEDVERAGTSPRLDIRGDAGTLSLGFMPAAYSGEGTLAADLQLGGETFERSAGVETVMGADFMTARWTQEVIGSDPLRLGLGVGFCGVGLKMKVARIDGGGEGQLDELIPLPLAVAKLEGGIGRLAYEASFGLHETGGSGSARRLEDLDARLSLDLNDAGALVLGYRRLQLDGTHAEDGASLDAVFGGPYLGLRVGF
ncbi:MAG: hypothetical protein MK297_01705 [Planctomycetes bacterium]|nr:hypothetical protein [Planctomycetota bacterium]